MPSPVSFNAAAVGMQPARFASRKPIVRDTEPEFGASARGQNHANETCSLPCGLGVVVAAVPLIAYAVALHVMTPKELKTKNIESVTVSKDANGAVIPKSFIVRSKVNDKPAEGVLKAEEKSGFFGFFKKATLTYDGTPATTKSVRMMFLPPYLKNLLNNGPDELGSVRQWEPTKDAMKLGEVDVPKGAKLGTNVYGEQIAVFKRGNDTVVVGPTEIGKDASPVKETVYTPDKVPAPAKKALSRAVLGTLF